MHQEKSREVRCRLPSPASLQRHVQEMESEALWRAGQVDTLLLHVQP